MGYWGAFYHQTKRAFLIQWEYRANFLFLFIMQLLYLASELVVLLVIFSYIPEIVGLNLYDFMLYALITDISGRLLHGLGLWINDEVVKGNMNNFLIRPKNELFQLLVPNIINCFFILTNIVILITLVCVLPINLDSLSIFLSIINFLISFPLILLPILIIRSFSFWVGDISAVESAYKSIMYSFQRTPIKVLSKIFFIIFVSITPMGYLHWYLTLVILIGKVSYSWMLWMWLVIIVLDVLMWFIFRFVYKRGLRRYEGFA